MKEFFKDVVINIFIDLLSKYIIGFFALLSGCFGLLDFNKFIERKEYLTAFIVYIFYSLVISGFVLIIYEILVTKKKRVKLDIIPKDSYESKGMWEKKYSTWIEIINDEKVDFDDCFAYLKFLDDNGINHLPEVTKLTNKFNWQNYSKEQPKRVRGKDRERVNIAFSVGGDVSKKYFCFDCDDVVLVPPKYRLGIIVVVSGKVKGIRKEFEFSGYLIHEMADFEKTMTKRIYLEPRVSQS